MNAIGKRRDLRLCSMSRESKSQSGHIARNNAYLLFFSLTLFYLSRGGYRRQELIHRESSP